MYLPILRGRQYELLALRELVNADKLSEKIIPIIEPVKVSSTFFKTIDAFIGKKQQVAIIMNPCVGDWNREINKAVNQEFKNEFDIISENEYVIPCYYVSPGMRTRNDKKCVFICNNQDTLDFYEMKSKEINPLYVLIPDRSEFRRRIRKNRILLEDHFKKKDRNADYASCDDEFFSSDHLYYRDDNYEGFSDYSIIGEEYSDSGFAPYAVAIHIVYFDNSSSLRVAHFVSDSNSDIKDVAGKFLEAVKKLHKWNKTKGFGTIGLDELENCYSKEIYPGLGVVKKYSIMHHIEIVGRFLDSES
ncbi:MAG: sce7725 family protein [Spirochaetales bacterium]|nr:sce7725 family protein [Spirochaetales bacterium]